jgi:hypothetical protein
MVRLTPSRLLCAAMLLCTIFLVSFITKLLYGPRGYELLEHPQPDSRPLSADVPYGEKCSPFQAGVMDDVTIVLRMGAGEVSMQLPAYLNRLGRCKQDLLLFSDRKAESNGLQVHDVLANLRPEYRYNNQDFDVYDAIQKGDNSDEKTREGWRLDKYKFLPMMELTRHFRPKSHWFVFIELDTYVNWDNMHRFLANFDPKTPYYFGSPVWPRKKPVFAHGGSGFVLSSAALDKLMARGRMFAENKYLPGLHLFGKDMQKECCGDEVLASVLKASGITIRGYWPMFNGEKPITARFGREQWCEAILTLHHLGADDFAALGRWESSSHRTPSKPLTFEELFTHIEPSLRDRIEDWANMSDDVTHRGHAGKSFDRCSAACMKDHKCMQFEHSGDTCRLSHDIRLGHHRPAEGGKRWTSGWVMERIEAFKAVHSPCDGAHFVHANP